MCPPESLIIHSLIAEMVVLEIQLSEVWQVIKGTNWDFLQLVTLQEQEQTVGY